MLNISQSDFLEMHCYFTELACFVSVIPLTRISLWTKKFLFSLLQYCIFCLNHHFLKKIIKIKSSSSSMLLAEAFVMIIYQISVKRYISYRILKSFFIFYCNFCILFYKRQNTCRCETDGGYSAYLSVEPTVEPNGRCLVRVTHYILPVYCRISHY